MKLEDKDISPALYPKIGYMSSAIMDKDTYQFQQDCLKTLLRKIRLESGLRQVDLAELLDQPQSFISKYESGVRRLDILELHQICGKMGISLEDFVHRLDGLLNEAK